jgi:hypothetical protein
MPGRSNEISGCIQALGVDFYNCTKYAKNKELT